MFFNPNVSYVIRARSIQPEYGVTYIPMVRHIPRCGSRDHIQIPVLIDADRCNKELGVPQMPPAKVFKLDRQKGVSQMYHFPFTIHEKLQEKFLGDLQWDRFIEELGEYGDAEFTEYGAGEFIYVQAVRGERSFTVISISYFNSPSIGKKMRQSTWKHPDRIEETLERLKHTYSIDYTHYRIKPYVKLGLVPQPTINPHSIDEFGEHF